MNYCQFMYYTLFGNKTLSRLLTNKVGEDVMESDWMCVCIYGVTFIKKKGLLVVGCSFWGWTQSRNSIQACNYVCLDMSSLVHYISSKDQVTYA